MQKVMVKLTILLSSLQLAFTEPAPISGLSRPMPGLSRAAYAAVKRSKGPKYKVPEQFGGPDPAWDNIIDAGGIALGGALVFSPERYAGTELLVQSAAIVSQAVPHLKKGGSGIAGIGRAPASAALIAALFAPAAAQFVPWLVIGGISRRAAEGIVSAMDIDADRKALLKALAGPLAAMASDVALTAANSSRISTSSLASAMLGGVMLVECSRGQLRHDCAKFLKSAAAPIQPLIDFLVDRLGPARRLLLPLAGLTANQMQVGKTLTQSSLGEAEKKFNKLSAIAKASVIAGVGVATQVPALSALASALFAGHITKTLEGEIESKVQRVLPGFLREKNVTRRARETLEDLEPFKKAASAYDDGHELIKKSARWVLPYYFATWGCAMQAGRLDPLYDTPRVLTYLLPQKWGSILPEPTSWVLGKVKKIYGRFISQPIKSRVKKGASQAAEVVGLDAPTSWSTTPPAYPMPKLHEMAVLAYLLAGPGVTALKDVLAELEAETKAPKASKPKFSPVPKPVSKPVIKQAPPKDDKQEAAYIIKRFFSDPSAVFTPEGRRKLVGKDIEFRAPVYYPDQLEMDAKLNQLIYVLQKMTVGVDSPLREKVYYESDLWGDQQIDRAIYTISRLFR